MAKRDRYTIEMYLDDALIESIIIISDNYPLVYGIASYWFDDGTIASRCLVKWKDVILAEFTEDARLDSVQQIPPSL